MFCSKIKFVGLWVAFCCLPAFGSIAFVTQNATAARGTSTSPAISVSAGQTLIVVAATDVAGSTITTVTDTGGDTFTKFATATNGGSQVTIWGVLSASSSTSVTCTINNNSGDIACMAATYTGVSSFGINNIATGSTANPSISLTTQDANNFVIAGLSNLTTTASTAGTGTLRRDITFSSRGSIDADLADNTAASISSVTVSVTHSATTWSAAAVELRSGAAGGTTPCYRTLMGAGC